LQSVITVCSSIDLLNSLLKSHLYTVERGKSTPWNVSIGEGGILKPEEERIVIVSVLSLVSLYDISYLILFISTYLD